MKTFFAISGVVETGTGVALALAPSAVVLLLFGAPLDSQAGLVIARILGAGALLARFHLPVCHDDAEGRTAGGLAAAMLLYNVTVIVLLVYTRTVLGISGIGFWPAVILHSVLLIWCVACRPKPWIRRV